MGLINKNYKINGYEYPTVYAVFNGEIKKLGDDLEVGFNIHGTRELALTEKPLEVKKVRVRDWDRKTDIVAYAYQKGKEKIPYTRYDDNGNPVVEELDNVFTNWKDDIQE